MSTFVKPYGDTRDDGKMQLSFTLPIDWSEAADEAARQLVTKMGFAEVISDHPLSPGYLPVRCHERGGEKACLYIRPGGCDARAALRFERQTYMEANDL